MDLQRLEALTQHLEERVEEHIDAYKKESKKLERGVMRLERDVMRLEREGRELKEKVNRVSHLLFKFIGNLSIG